MASVTIEGVEKSYGATKVIHGINVEARDGEFVVLVGPSGCGKSTLLRMIAGLEEISRGRIRIGDRVVNNLSPKDRDIAMVFQNYALYPHMSVRENMEFSLRLQKMPAKEREDRVKRAAGILGIEQLLHRRPGQLSGGQRQRVAMGRAIVRDPKVFLFDEPLSNLDAKLRVQMRGEIRDLHRRLGTTCIYVTHDQIEAMTMADRIVVMRDGVVEQVGSPLELYDRPANAFVGAFLGSPAMNFLPGKLTADGGPAFVTQSGLRIALPAATGVGDGGEVLCGFRPEAVELGGAQPLRAVVRAVEPTGSETHLFATLDGVDIVAVLRDRISPAIGEEVPISIAPPRVHLFDARTTTRLN